MEDARRTKIAEQSYAAGFIDTCERLACEGTTLEKQANPLAFLPYLRFVPQALRAASPYIGGILRAGAKATRTLVPVSMATSGVKWLYDKFRNTTGRPAGRTEDVPVPDTTAASFLTSDKLDKINEQ